MDLHSNSQGEYGRFEQILTQFLLKSLHITLDSRVPSIRPYNRSGEVKKSDKWFSLVLGDRPAALDDLNFWQRNLMEPMIIDIILVQETPNSMPELKSRSALGLGTFVETVIERWVVQYECIGATSPQVGDASYKKTYQKSIILLRSLYSMLRLLPAYKAFQKLCSSSQTCDFEINYKVSSFSAPFSRAEEEVMKQYSFVPVDAQQGRLSISVTYRESLSDFNLETSTSFPPEIITDYVRSPATDPLRAFPSDDKGFCATSVPFRGMQPPSMSPFQRPHSWTSGLHKGVAPLAQNRPFSGSPPMYHSPMLYEYSSSPTDVHGPRGQHYRLPTHHKTTSFDEYQLSPPFSSSPSPSPPTYLSGGTHVQTRLHSETAPTFSSTSIPRSTRQDPSSQESPSGIRSLKKSDSLRATELNSGIPNQYAIQKISRDSKDDSGRFSALLSSSGSPRIGFSRSSSRFSLQDDLDDCDFSCPFIVDDVDPDSQASQYLDGKKASETFSMARKSQDAAAGALIQMLRAAPPLRQDSSCYSSRCLKTELEGELGASSGSFLARKTSDALEELRAYKEMKDLLFSKSTTQVIGKEES
ncbi:unnamed protein product [Ilex paraguariensis]|uniref:Autophagy-related protein 13 N-terminal domain-containing protein n=1 Tax=Ilex paraguariensis TaxID=185542 RepID=A0ABC8TTH7_9AQUA